jgi:hypothetical protein
MIRAANPSMQLALRNRIKLVNFCEWQKAVMIFREVI